MSEFTRGFIQAFHLITTFDPLTFQALFLSLRVTLIALLFSSVLGFPIGIILAFTRFKGKKLIMNLVYTFMGFPPVVAGLIVYLLLSRSGPLGFLKLLFTPQAMIFAQIILSLPVIIGLTVLGLRAIDISVYELSITLGATRAKASLLLLREARLSILGALITAFGASISEVGAAMLVGGNIEGLTRSMTTALMLETRQGNFDRALALGIILLLLAFLVNSILVLFGDVQGIKKNARQLD
jgi:tungstate transport system permease protein